MNERRGLECCGNNVYLRHTLPSLRRIIKTTISVIELFVESIQFELLREAGEKAAALMPIHIVCSGLPTSIFVCRFANNSISKKPEIFSELSSCAPEGNFLSTLALSADIFSWAQRHPVPPISCLKNEAIILRDAVWHYRRRTEVKWKQRVSPGNIRSPLKSEVRRRHSRRSSA